MAQCVHFNKKVNASVKRSICPSVAEMTASKEYSLSRSSHRTRKTDGNIQIRETSGPGVVPPSLIKVTTNIFGLEFNSVVLENVHTSTFQTGLSAVQEHWFPDINKAAP